MAIYIFAAIAVIVAIVVAFLMGMQHGLHLYAKRFIEDCYAGDLIIDMQSVESDTISVDFERNPKELMGYQYVAMGVKVKLP